LKLLVDSSMSLKLGLSLASRRRQTRVISRDVLALTIQVGRADIECLLRGSEPIAVREEGRFVAFVAIGVKGVGPAVGGEMPEPAEADGI
jgi:hypothetical protein